MTVPHTRVDVDHIQGNMILTSMCVVVSAESFLVFNWGTGEMSQRLRALASLPEDLGLVPSTYMAAKNHL